MPSENYDFTPWDSEDDIAKFLPALLAGARMLGGKAIAAGAKKIGVGALKGGLKGAAKKVVKDKAKGVAVNAATSGVSQLTGGGANNTPALPSAGSTGGSTNAASEAVESVTPKPASDGSASVPLPETPEPASTEPAAPAESPEGESKSNTKQMGMQMASQMMAQGAQKKQAQEQRAMDIARRGATISTGTPMGIAMRLLKGPVYPAFGLDNFNQYIAPLGDAISQGHDNFQHVNTTPTNESQREHLQTQTDLRVDNSRTRNYPVPNDHNHNYDSPSSQFLMDSHLQLEHLMRTQPTLFNDIKEGQRVFLQTGVVPQGWDSNPSLELPKESSNHVRNTYNQRTRTGGTLDHHSGKNISERIHPLVRKPHDLGVVYHRKDGKFTPITTSPTAMWKPKKSNKFLSARPMGVFQNDIPAKHKEEISARHRQYNGENGYMGVPVANQASVLRHSHKEPEIREEPKKVGVRGSISGELPETLNSHYTNTKNGLNIKGGIGKKWADQSNPNSLPRRISSINDAHDIGLINQNDKGVFFTYLLQAAIDSGHVKMNDLTSPFNQKGWKVNDDETWKEAIMNISKAEMQRIEDVLLKERKSPEAFKHKKEYDSKYEASPERVKYREGLNNERRKRGMYGDHSHQDISHTEGGKLTVENEHDNRARHFKDKGTLRPIAKSMRDDLELLRNLMSGPMDEQDKKIAESLLASIDEEEDKDSEVSSELEHPYPI